MALSRLRSWRGWEAVALLGILALSLGLRLWELGAQNLWLDELFTVSITSAGPAHAVAGTAADTNPPLYYVLQSLVSPWLGRSEYAMRLLPAATSVLATLVIYAIGKKAFGGAVGLWAALLFAVLPRSIEYAQEARMYSLLMLLTAVAILAFVMLVEKPGWIRATLFGVSLAAVAYSHVYGYMVAAAFALPVLALPRVRRAVGRYSLASFCVAIVLFLPWTLMISRQVHSVLASASKGTWWGEPVDEVVTQSVSRLMWLVPSTNVILSLLFAGLFALGLPFSMKVAPRQPGEREVANGVQENDIVWTLLAVGILPVVFGVTVSKYVTMVATNRNTLVALPAACLLIARGASRFRRPVTVLLLGICVVWSIAVLPGYYRSTSKGQWRTITTDALSATPNHAVVAETYVNALQLATYADVLGGSKGLHLMWTDSSFSDAHAPNIAGWQSSYDTKLSSYLTGLNQLVVVSETGDPGPAEKYMRGLAGWAEKSRYFDGGVVVHVWTRKP